MDTANISISGNRANINIRRTFYDKTSITGLTRAERAYAMHIITFDLLHTDDETLDSRLKNFRLHLEEWIIILIYLQIMLLGDAEINYTRNRRKILKIAKYICNKYQDQVDGLEYNKYFPEVEE